VRLRDVDPGFAVGVEGRPTSIFALGSPCAGYVKVERLGCLTHPLEYDGRVYAGSRYPGTPAPQGTVRLGEELGSGELAGQTVSVRGLEGVDPAVAVGVEGRPAEAFLAPGVCPYERFANEAAVDDLAKCLEAPVWFSFDPPGARIGEDVVARTDRALGAELDGAQVSLARLKAPGDHVPLDLSGSAVVGTLAGAEDRAEVPFTVPQLEQGIYEAVVTCEACADGFGGRTVFPAGPILVLEQQSQSSNGRLIGFALAGAFVVALIASVIVWRKGWRPRKKRGATDAE
jgi:hypothetical protein